MTESRRLRFVSRNTRKLEEAREILSSAGVQILPLQVAIDELQTDDVVKLVTDKALKAFAQVGRPLIVEHTGLHLEMLGGLPGGLTQVFWDRLQAERFAELFGRGGVTSVVARTIIGYLDGRRLHFFSGEVAGHVASEPRGPRDFQWDCIFIPVGEAETFAEMGIRKNQISMRRKALDHLAEHLRLERREI